MKKYFLLFVLSIFIISCSKKKVIISGKLNNALPLSRVEIIDISSVATLPITNFGIDEKGNFSDTISIDKNGIYALIYQGRIQPIYLKKGQNIHIIGNGSNFPEDIKIIGEGQANNEFLSESAKFVNEYLSSKISVDILKKNEADFIKEMEKYATDINKKLDEIAKTKKTDNEVLNWKKDELLVNLLIISSQYELMHGQITGKSNFKVSEDFKKKQKMLEKSSFIETFPEFRQYLLMKLQNDFQVFAKPYLNNTKITQTEVFLKFLDTRKELDQKTKDYLASFIATQFDFTPQNHRAEQVYKVLSEKIQSSDIKKELEKVFHAILGVKIGSQAPEGMLIGQDGKTLKISSFKGKPTLLVFYNSSSPAMIEHVVPTLKELSNFYKTKMNFVYVNFEDNQKQFQNTSKALMKDLFGTNVYPKGGLKSEMAKQYHIYGFKLPSFVVLDKDGKIVSQAFLNIAEPKLIDILNKQTGLNAPIQNNFNDIESHHEHDGHNH